MSSFNKIRTRIAPSPTGFLHLGTARTALYSWAYARHHGGEFVLRIEDTDVARSTQDSVDQIIEAMNAKGLPVTYVLYPEEGHGFAVPENRIAFNAIAEAFLAAHLGGRAEPIGGDFSGAKFEVREGASHVPGLQTALAGRPST